MNAEKIPGMVGPGHGPGGSPLAIAIISGLILQWPLALVILPMLLHALRAASTWP